MGRGESTLEKPQTGDGPLSPAQGEGIDEEELVDRCQSGPTEAFEFLYERHKSNIFQLCRALLWRSGVNRDEITADAMDATQEVFLKALKSIRSFDKRSAFYTWLYRIAINVCKNIRRTWKSRRGLLRFGEPE
ncbi:MAG: sigma-70 family RNA polymerase sigma factor, partial [Candidatus Aminicenantes bacterium]|nr:sigma-70 family RNA polymerase sigma factor [Candidatus Aminicenantes bacterium]